MTLVRYRGRFLTAALPGSSWLALNPRARRPRVPRRAKIRGGRIRLTLRTGPAHTPEDLPGKWQAAVLKAEQNRPKLRVIAND